MNAQWQEIDAQRLRANREEAGLSAATLAKFNALSLAQLRELEEGGQVSFYSMTIKAQVGRKLLRFLGADAHGVTGDLQPVTHAHPNNELPRCGAVLELEKVVAQARQNLDPDLSQRIGDAFIEIWQEHAALSAFFLLVLSFLLLAPILMTFVPPPSAG